MNILFVGVVFFNGEFCRFFVFLWFLGIVSDNIGSLFIFSYVGVTRGFGVGRYVFRE